MSINPVTQYPGKVAPATPDNPFGTARNITIPGDGTGTPWESALLKDEWALHHAMLLNAGMEPNGNPDSAENSQLFKAAKASIGNGANLLSNHNFLTASPDTTGPGATQPPPDATPRSYPPGFQILSGVFANETTGITDLTYINGRVSFTTGDFYIPRANSKELENITDFVASVADFDGKPRTRGVSYALVGSEYRVTVGVDALEDAGANATPLGSVKFEQGNVATGHEVECGVLSNGSSIPVTLGERFSYKRSVFDFSGATLTEKIQAAIDASAGYQTVVIPYLPGGLEVNHTDTASAVQVNKPINIEINSSIKNAYQAESQPNPPTIFNVTSDNVNIYGLGSLEGSGLYTAAGIQASVNDEWSSLIYLNDVDNVSVTGVTLINAPKAGIYIRSSSNLDISCKFIGGPTFSEVSGHHSQANIYSYLGGGNNTITGCKFLKDESTGRVAVQHILNSTDAVPFKWNVSYNSFQSPHEHDTYLYLNGSIVNGNTMIHSSPSAEQQGSALKMGGDRNVIMSNNITGATSGGIDVISPSNTIISYNILKDVGTVGINVDNNTAITHRMDNNEISHNRLTGINNNFEGIRYIFDTTYGSDVGCSGGKICNNTVDSFGNSSTVRSSIVVRRNGTTSEVMDNFEICGNIVTGSNGNGIYLSSVKNPKVRHNNIYDNPALTFRAIYLDDVNGGDVEFNDVADHQAVTTLNAAIYTTNNAENLSINNNNVYGSYTGAVPIFLNQANNNTGVGNRISEVDNLSGVFTMNGISAIEVFNSNILDSGLLSQNTVIDIRPLNQEAAAAMGSAKMLFVYDKDAGLSFKVRTSDNSVLPATDHVFSYQIN
jgi:parallel beta-helix repeat protein